MRTSPLRHNLARLRLFLNLGQKEMADLAGCSRRAIQSVELRTLKLSEELARKISNETGIAVDWLLENDLKAPLTSVRLGPFRIEDYNETRALRDLGATSVEGLFQLAWGGVEMNIAISDWMHECIATKV